MKERLPRKLAAILYADVLDVGLVFCNPSQPIRSPIHLTVLPRPGSLVAKAIGTFSVTASTLAAAFSSMVGSVAFSQADKPTAPAVRVDISSRFITYPPNCIQLVSIY